MKWILKGPKELTLQEESIELHGLTPIVNGAEARDWGGEWVVTGAGRIERSGLIEPGGTRFGVWIEREPTSDVCSLGYWLEAAHAQRFSPGTELDNFGLQFARVSGLGSYLRSGYTSWDGSFFVQPEALAEAGLERLEMGYALTQLLPQAGAPAAAGAASLVVGFDRHDRFQHTFSWRLQDGSPSMTLTALTLWDRKALPAGEKAVSERLLFLAHPQPEEALRFWARRVAAASPLPPRQRQPLTGWCSWYNLYAAITEENLLEHLHAAASAARREALPIRIFQIDDGFTPEMGDWMHLKPQFPRGMRPLLDDIRAEGFLPGLWIAPFLVGNRSRLYYDHPDWVVLDRETGGPLVEMRFYGEFRWHKRSEEYYILDITHPEAEEYMRSVFRAWRRDWGCKYFKTDFMHAGSRHGPARAAWHTPGLTRIEIWRKMGMLIREEIGEDAIWLGCGCPLWASVGLVDGIRIGKDVGVEWEKGAGSLLVDACTRNFAHGILWQADPDCILLRQRFHHLSDEELQALALYASMTGGVRMTSDHLGELSADRMRLWKLILGWSGDPCRFPFFGKARPAARRGEGAGADPVIVQVRDAGGNNPFPGSPALAVFIFNTGEEKTDRRYALQELGSGAPAEAIEWQQETVVLLNQDLELSLEPHQGRLFFIRAAG